MKVALSLPGTRRMELGYFCGLFFFFLGAYSGVFGEAEFLSQG